MWSLGGNLNTCWWCLSAESVRRNDPWVDPRSLCCWRFGILRCIAALSLLDRSCSASVSRTVIMEELQTPGAAEWRGQQDATSHLRTTCCCLKSVRGKKKKDCPSLHRSFCRLFRPPARHTRRPVAAGLCGVNQTGDGPPSIIWFYWIIAVWRAK